MAYFLFVSKIIEGQAIDVFNRGEMERDFTFIDDIVEGVALILSKTPIPDPGWSGKKPEAASSSAPYRLYNIGADSPVNLMDFIREIEERLGIKAKLNLLPLQPGDVVKTQADISPLVNVVGALPGTDIKSGVRKFVDWYVDFYKVKLPR